MSDYTRSNVLTSFPLTINDIVFRLAREDDLPKLEWFGEYTHFRSIFDYTFQEQKKQRRLMLLADFNGFPIGQIFILFKESGFLFGGENERGYLYSLRVMEPFQHLGIGTALLQRAESLMLERRLSYATIAVAKDNDRALRLYERSGFTIYAEDDGRWSYIDHEGNLIDVHEPCWLMEKILSI
ncbi:MAG TPA: GNAT family N-acetyltransferase [Aggregatilineales bacterium]|nr:GNAT family N-acetyltransferase [Aggregatilineales bacterium]